MAPSSSGFSLKTAGSKSETQGRMVCWKKFAHLIAARKQRKKGEAREKNKLF